MEKTSSKIIRPVKQMKTGHKYVSIPRKEAEKIELSEGDYVEITKI